MKRKTRPDIEEVFVKNHGLVTFNMFDKGGLLDGYLYEARLFKHESYLFCRYKNNSQPNLDFSMAEISDDMRILFKHI